MQVNPFRRAHEFFSALAAIAMLSAGEQQAKLLALGAYESHGKGGKQPHRRVGTKAHARAALKARNQRRNRAAHR